MAGLKFKGFAHIEAIPIGLTEVFQIKAHDNVGLKLSSVRLSFTDLAIGPLEIGYAIGQSEGTGGTAVTLRNEETGLATNLQATCWLTPFNSPAITGGNFVEQFNLGPGGLLELLEKEILLPPGETLTVHVGGDTVASAAFFSVTVQGEE